MLWSNVQSFKTWYCRLDQENVCEIRQKDRKYDDLWKECEARKIIVGLFLLYQQVENTIQADFQRMNKDKNL